MTSDQMTARAFEIADASMIGCIEEHCIRCDEHGQLWSFVDSSGAEVHCVIEAHPDVVEAVDWLTARKLAEVVDSLDGEVLVLMEDGGCDG